MKAAPILQSKIPNHEKWTLIRKELQVERSTHVSSKIGICIVAIVASVKEIEKRVRTFSTGMIVVTSFSYVHIVAADVRVFYRQAGFA